ncbi:MAG: amidase [Burkholderiaceae bacterium]|nr:amidase [Gemmatimonadales bacterium]MCO5118431.1 amidase [Burkholderiaceae bacterium]MEB2319557.1 amidase [Pseudomonadota bacterium]
MSRIPPDPFEAGGLARFATDFRSGRISSLEATTAYLARIEALDSRLRSFQRVDREGALATARAIDALRAAGTDLGPLMGVPIAVKDVFAIDGFPTPSAGSLIDFSGIAGDRQGPFISALRRCGVVILGTTKAVELCLGITGVSAPLGTPWNPWDLDEQRVPGGSSSGSGVACGAGLCAFAIGSDTGGSVRVPAAFNGLFGLKTTFGHWPTDAAVPLHPDVDTIGLLTRSAQDARIAFDAIDAQLFGYRHEPFRQRVDVDRLRIGIPTSYYYDDLAPEIRQAVDAANSRLATAGSRLDPIEVAEAVEREGYFPVALPVSCLALFGSDTIASAVPTMDPIVAARVNSGRSVQASDYLAIDLKRRRSIRNAQRYFDAVDVIATPTTVDLPPPLAAFDDPAQAMRFAMGMTRNTQPSNYLGQCAATLSLPRAPGELPIGYQLIGAPGADGRLLAIAAAIEEVLGRAGRPDLSRIGG